MDKKSNVHSIFSSIACKYDRLNSILSFNTDKLWRRKAIRLCDLKNNDKVLDLCCGTGSMIDYICKEVGQETEVTGLDFNEEMLKVGYQRLNQSVKGYKFRLIKGNMLDLPFEDNSFDCITIAFGLRNSPDVYKTITEMYRVLRQRGKVICLELSNPETPVFKELYALYFNNVLPVIGFIGTGDKTAYYYLRDSVRNFLSKDELQSKFDQAGFADTGYVSLTGGIASIHYGRKL